MKLFNGHRVVTLVAVLALNAGLLAQAPAKPGPKKKPAPKTATAPPPAKAPEPPPPPPPTDVRLHTSITTGAQVSGNTTFIQGARQRVEFPEMTVISQCDLGQTLQINDQSKHYIVQKHQAPESAQASDTASSQQAAMQQQMMQAQQQGMMGGKGGPPKGGVITYTTTLTDTGEKQQFFGLDARHVKTVTVGESTDNACTKVKTRIEVDAWYLDVPPTMAGCTPRAEVKAPPSGAADVCTDRIENKTVGDAKLGFPVKSTTTTTTGEAADQTASVLKMEVDTLEITRLDKSLFDVPAGYSEVTSYNDLVPSVAAGGSLAEALLGSVKNGTRTVKPKDAGTVRIGVPEPANKSQRDLSASQLQEELVNGFTKAPYEAVPIYGSTPQELIKDAQTKECDHVLVTTVAEAKTSHSGKAGGILKMVSGDPAKDNQEVKLEYKLYDVTDPDKVESSNVAKANNGGGFGMKSAMHLAMFAGQMYMGFGMNRLMMGQLGGALGASSLMGGGMAGMFNPTMGAMNMVMSGASQMAMQGMMGGMGGGAGNMQQMQSDQEFRQTMSKALGSVRDSVTSTLNKPTTTAKK